MKKTTGIIILTTLMAMPLPTEARFTDSSPEGRQTAPGWTATWTSFKENVKTKLFGFFNSSTQEAGNTAYEI